MCYFWCSELKQQTKEIVDAVLDGSDCVAVMPTGGGKSACYFFPGLLENGVTLVISPLNALIDDHITQLVSRGVFEILLIFPLIQILMLDFIS